MAPKRASIESTAAANNNSIQIIKEGAFQLSDDHKHRKNIQPGMLVDIVEKQNQKSGKITTGEVKDILTSSANHPHGIKVRLITGQVGRVQNIHKS